MKFYGQFSVPVDEFIYERYFKNDKRENLGFFIECGAFDGLTDSSCKFFEETLGWKGVNIEASPPVYKKLIENRPNSTNVNVALSNGTGKTTFKHVIHPQLGEMYGNGSLCHSEEHMQELLDRHCTFKDYEVDVIRYSDLIKRYNIEAVDLFVLDVEGNELNVIESMKNCSVLPEIFVLAHGHLDQAKVIRAVEELGYDYDTKSYVNSFFVKRSGTIASWWKNTRRKLARTEKFFKLAEQTEKHLVAGRFIKKFSLSPYDNTDPSAFAKINCVSANEGYITILSLSGLEGENCAGQTVYYAFKGDRGDSFFIKPVQQERRDYADIKGSDLYLQSGSFCVIKKEYLRSAKYNITVFIENRLGKYKVENLVIKI